MTMTEGKFDSDFVFTSTGPVHWLENVDGDPHMVRTACRRFSWARWSLGLLDPNRTMSRDVTCPECLEAMCDVPVTVEVDRDATAGGEQAEEVHR